MEKALKFLKEQEKACNDYLGAFTEQDLIDYEGDDEVEAIKQVLTEAQEAIVELEEAMKPKTCNECEWWDFNSYGIFKKCFNGKGNCVSTESSFGCNRFKQRDNA